MSYGDVVAVDGLDLTIDRGTITAVLGPNAAGKTTTLETCEGYRRPQAGDVRVLGLDPWAERKALLPRIGVMLQQGGAWSGVHAMEMLRHVAAMHAHPLDVDALGERLGLPGCGKTPYRRLSGGQQQRLGLAMAVVGRPELVFVDEPTAGMDPQARHITWDLLRELREAGVTVVLTTHYIEEAERLADQVHIIDRGRLVVSGTPVGADRRRRTAPRGRVPGQHREVALVSLDLSPAPGAAPLAKQVRAQASMEVRLLLRNGEQLLLAVVIPVLVLVGGVIGADRVGIDLAHRPVDALTPGVLALAIMSTSFTSVAIATGFERRYGVLKRLGATPLPRLGLLAAKVLALLVVEVLQLLVLSLVALVLGWSPSAGVVGAVGFVLAWLLGHGGVRLARAAAGGYVARRGDAGRRQPHLPAAARRRGRGAAEHVVRRVRLFRAVVAVGCAG